MSSTASYILQSSKHYTNSHMTHFSFITEPLWSSSNTQDCHGIGCGFNPCLWYIKKGYPWALTAVNPNCFINSQVLYIVICSHGQDKDPLRILEQSRELSQSQVSIYIINYQSFPVIISQCCIQTWVST